MKEVKGIYLDLTALSLSCAFLLIQRLSPPPAIRIAVGLPTFLLLPGLLIHARFAPPRDLSQLFLVGLATSPIIVALPTYFLTAHVGFSLVQATTAVVVLMCLLAAGGFVCNRRNPSSYCLCLTVSWDTGLWIVFVALFIAVAWLLFAHPRIQLSYHGTVHIPYVYQIINGIIPPENPLLFGYPANFYWVYFLWLAILSTTHVISPLQAQAVSNLLALVGTFGLLYLAASVIRLSRLYRHLAAWLSVFGTNNPTGVAIFLFRLVRRPWLLPSAGETSPSLLALMVWRGDTRLTSMIGKFINFQGFGFGYMYVILAVLGVLFVLTRRGHRCLGYLLLAWGTAGSLAFHGLSGIVPLAMIPAALGIAFLLVSGPKGTSPACHRAHSYSIIGELLKFLIPIGLASLAMLPYLLSTTRAFKVPPSLPVWRVNNLWSILSSYVALLVPFALGIRTFLKQRRAELLFVISLTFLISLAAAFTVWPGFNQYKFVYLMSIPVGLVAAIPLDDLLSAVRGRVGQTAARVLGALLVLGLALSPALTIWGYCWSSWARSRELESAGIAVELSDEQDERAMAYRWIREHTDKRAVLIEKPRSKDELILGLIAQRLIYTALKTDFHTAGYPVFETRLKINEQLFTPQVPKRELLQAIRNEGRELYLVLDQNDLGPDFDRLVTEYRSLTEFVEQVYDSPQVKIFHILPGGS